MHEGICASEEASSLSKSLLHMTGDCAVSRLLYECFLERPELMPVLRDMGAWSLVEYGKQLICADSCLSPSLRTIISGIVSTRFGTGTSSAVSEALLKLDSLDTAGHGGIFSEDTLVQGHLIAGRGVIEKGLLLYVGFACGVVPMNNSTWPRGFYVQGERESIFPKAFDKTAYHECGPFSREQIRKGLSDSKISSGKRLILETLDSISGIYDQKLYFEQASLANFHLWKRSFEGERTIPQFVQLMLEEVTAPLLMHSIESQDWIYDVLFNEKVRRDVLASLDGMPGTWNQTSRKGTQFFWYRSGDFRTASLWVDGDSLMRQGEQALKLDPDSIHSALGRREIVPGVFLSLLLLRKNGARCLGGYHQISYFPEYKRRLRAIAERIPEFGTKFTVNSCDRHEERFVNMSYGPVFIQDDEREGLPASIDLFLRKPEKKFEVPKLLETTTVVKGCAMNLKRWYNEIVPQEKRQKTLQDLTERGIFLDILKAGV